VPGAVTLTGTGPGASGMLSSIDALGWPWRSKLPLAEFYHELVKTQAVINRKHLGVAALAKTAQIVGRHLRHGHTNFARMLWKFPRTYNAQRQLADHSRPVRYELPQPRHADLAPRDRRQLYIHAATPGGPGLDSVNMGKGQPE
jgi:hypothetical protein